jgi:hypothetical protein
MAPSLRAFGVLSALWLLPCAAGEQPQVYFLRFSAADSALLGQIDKLEVTVSCSWVVSLKNVPELYNVSMGYEIPTENLLEATPRLGAAAVDLSRWSGVIGIRFPPDADAQSCFKVKVRAVGREGPTGVESPEHSWTGKQLGLPR